MKKILMALMVSSMLVGTSFANGGGLTVVYKLNSVLGNFANGGIQKSGLPRTAYLVVDEYGDGYVVWYWTVGIKKYSSEPLCVWGGDQNETGYNNQLFQWETDLHQDSQNVTKSKQSLEVLGYNQSAAGHLELAGAGAGTVQGITPSSNNPFPVSLAGFYYNEVVQIDAYNNNKQSFNDGYDEYLGFGYGTTAAAFYAVATDSDAWTMADALAQWLQSKGYSIPSDGTDVYQSY